MALSVGLLLLRVVVGLVMIGHGSQKLLGWFGGAGLKKQIASMKGQGYKPAWLWVFFVCLGEVGGGLSLATGLLMPLGAAGIVGAMVMASRAHWKNGFWNAKRGFEYPLMLLTVAVALGLAGPGDYSLDALLNLGWPNTLIFGVLAVAAVIVDVIGILMLRHAAPPPAPAAAAPASAPASGQKEPSAAS